MNPQLEGLKFDSNGLIPAIIQDHVTGEVLMFAFMNEISIAKTVETGMCHYYSRSRQKLWLKGETSGHLQHVKSIRTDCDKDVILISIEQVGVACHDGYRSCFYREFHKEQSDWTIVGNKLVDPDQVYKNK